MAKKPAPKKRAAKAKPAARPDNKAVPRRRDKDGSPPEQSLRSRFRLQ